jgi:V8-like Glu-specific endopeptidase
MIKVFRFWGVLTLTTLALGCVAESTTGEQVDRTDAPIIQGTETTGYANIIALVGKKPGQEGVALCTASLVTPTILLTAAHCVSPAVVGEGLVFKAILAPNLVQVDAAHPPRIVDVAAVHWDQAFNIQQVMNGHDIGVAVLAQPIDDIVPLKINRAPLPALSKARLVGYGLNNAQQQTGAGIKRTAEVPVGSVNDKFVVTGSWFGTTMCQGDSGGPVLGLLNGEETIIGINSFGFIQCLGSGNSTRVDSYPEFLDTYVR